MKNIRLAVATITGIFMLHGCKGEIHGDNSEQKRKSHRLLVALEASSPESERTGSTHGTALPSYHSKCANAQPKIPHANCINIATEGDGSIDANGRAFKLASKIATLKAENKIPDLAGTTVIVSPIYRVDNFKGEVTPYSLPRHFSINSEITINF